MGHKMTDIDSLGAAIGIYCAARQTEKQAYIVADDVSDSIRPVIKGFRDNPDYSADMFIDRKRAKELTNADTALVVVDTNKASYTACEELLHLTNTIVVLDHHRQGDDRIQNAVLSYIEPYASSACEMVAEVLQYYDENLKLQSQEADAELCDPHGRPHLGGGRIPAQERRGCHARPEAVPRRSRGQPREGEDDRGRGNFQK